MKKHAKKFEKLRPADAVLSACGISDVLVTDGAGEFVRPEIFVAMDVYARTIVAWTIRRAPLPRLTPRNGGNHGNSDIDDA